MITLKLIINSMILGIGLAMDAFSVSLANGLHDPKMKIRKILGISSIFALFQALMPLIGWICVHTISKAFSFIEQFIPWIALFLLCMIGGKMLAEGIRGEEEEIETESLTWKILMVQGIATSIDALSVGFTIVDYTWNMALVCVCVIALVTFIICFAGVLIGKRFGMRFSNRATILGGLILIAIGIEIFISSLL